MSNENQRYEKFLNDVKKHVMTIENDTGVHRCLHFGRPGSSAYHFRITTWPGHLAISGDMGDSVFARLPDMFNFFRGEPGSINVGYWSEKMKAMPKEGYKTFDWDEFGKGVLEIFTCDLDEFPDQYPEGTIEAVKDALRLAEHDEHGAIQLVREWEYYELPHVDWCDYSHLLEGGPSSSHIWRLHAIVWAISKYDEAKASEVQA